jgi:Protein of unknown function (DUF3467)
LTGKCEVGVSIRGPGPTTEENRNRAGSTWVSGKGYGLNMEVRLTRSEKLNAAPYADMAIVGHTPHGFTLEFVAIEPLMQGDDGTVQGTVVARVKLPPSVIFQIASAIAENVDLYEKQFGPITARPRLDS